MKILFSVESESTEAEVCQRFGRSPKFGLYDSETKSFTWHDNKQNLQAAQGAGIQSAQNACRIGADWVVTGNCGPKAFAVLSSEGVKVALVKDGTILELAEKIVGGEIEPVDAANVEGHW